MAKRPHVYIITCIRRSFMFSCSWVLCMLQKFLLFFWKPLQHLHKIRCCHAVFHWCCDTTGGQKLNWVKFQSVERSAALDQGVQLKTGWGGCHTYNTLSVITWPIVWSQVMKFAVLSSAYDRRETWLADTAWCGLWRPKGWARLNFNHRSSLQWKPSPHVAAGPYRV